MNKKDELHLNNLFKSCDFSAGFFIIKKGERFAIAKEGYAGTMHVKTGFMTYAEFCDYLLDAINKKNVKQAKSQHIRTK